MSESGDLLHVVTDDQITPQHEVLGRLLVWGSFGVLVLTFVVLELSRAGMIEPDVETWRSALYAYLFQGTCLCIAQVVQRGEQGKRTLFILPIALPGMVAAFILSLVLTWNEYFLAALLTSTDAKTLPVMVASQTGSQGINWWSMAALSASAILPLISIGVLLERFIIKGMASGAVK